MLPQHIPAKVILQIPPHRMDVIRVILRVIVLDQKVRPMNAVIVRLPDLGAARPSLVVCGHVHQYRETWAGETRHVWGTSTGYVIPDRRQPRYGLKEVGYVEHRLHEDGAHDSTLVRVPGVPTLDIADFPGAYGPV